MDRRRYFESAKQAWHDLEQYEDRTFYPAPEPHCYIGGAIRGVRAMLLGPCYVAQQLNEADQGADEAIIRANDTHLTQIMVWVDRAFFSAIHTSVQMGLETICEKEGWQVENSQARQVDAVIRHIGQKDTQGLFAREIKALKRMRPNYPRFDDYLNTVLKHKDMPEQFVDMARKYFTALSLMRNKCSHTDVTLTPKEEKRLWDGGFAAAISAEGGLVVGPMMFPQIVRDVLHFFDTVMASPSRSTEEP